MKNSKKNPLCIKRLSFAKMCKQNLKNGEYKNLQKGTKNLLI